MSHDKDNDLQSIDLGPLGRVFAAIGAMTKSETRIIDGHVFHRFGGGVFVCDRPNVSTEGYKRREVTFERFPK